MYTFTKDSNGVAYTTIHGCPLILDGDLTELINNPGSCTNRTLNIWKLDETMSPPLYYTVNSSSKRTYLIELLTCSSIKYATYLFIDGEVFTPLDVIGGGQLGGAASQGEGTRMLDKLPDDVWIDPTLKWLDPANGIGNFPICVYYRLMEGLMRGEFTDREECSRHIIENMLYMVELDPLNVLMSKTVFCERSRGGDAFDANIHEGSFLEDDLIRKINGGAGREWPEKFDIIMGNPPFSVSNDKKVWVKFVKQSLAILKPDGYLTFIHPSHWLDQKLAAHLPLLEKHIEWLETWDSSYAKTIFSGHGEIPCSVYVLHNIPNTDNLPTRITSRCQRLRLTETYDYYLDPAKDLPRAYFDDYDKLLRIQERYGKLNVIGDATTRTKPLVPGNEIMLPQVYTLDDNYGVKSEVVDNKIKVCKLAEPHQDANKGKLILANASTFSKSILDDGRLGIVKGGEAYYILEDESGRDGLQRLADFFKLDLINNLMITSKTRGGFPNPIVFTWLPDIRKIPIEDLPTINNETFATLLRSGAMGGSPVKSSTYLRPYIKQHGGTLTNLHQDIRDGISTTRRQRKVLYGLANRMETIIGTPLRESQFNTLVRHMNQPRFLKQVVQQAQLTGGGHSRRIRPMWREFKYQRGVPRGSV